MVKNLPAMWESWVRSLGWEDPLEKGMATHSNLLAWRIPWTEEPGRLLSIGSQRVVHDWNWRDLACTTKLKREINSLCHPHLLLPSIFPSIKVFSNELALRIRWPKYWNFSFSIRPSNEYSGLISFRIDWFDLLIVLGTLKSPLQHHSSKALILWPSAFFMAWL